MVKLLNSGEREVDITEHDDPIWYDPSGVLSCRWYEMNA